MAAYTKTLYDSTGANILYPQTLAQVVYTQNNQNVETVLNANGSGLSAVQVGVLKRIFVININGCYIEFINPEIIKQSGEQYNIEGCLSVDMPYGYVKRPMNVTVKALDRNGNKFTFSATDYTAIAICHENDHLDGILYIDKCKKFVTKDDE